MNEYLPGLVRSVCVGLVALIPSATTAFARSGTCTPAWVPTFGTTPGMDHEVFAATTWDSGTGPELYAAGSFTLAGSTVANHVARWDGVHWNALGGGVGGAVFALAAHDDGTGTALYAGGSFGGGVLRWNGSVWSPVGGAVNGTVQALAVFDDGSGSGPALFVGGFFNGAGTSGAQNMAKWNGTTWSAIANGPNGTVRSFAVWDDGLGGGPALYVGGGFGAGSPIVRNVGKWNGSTWSSLGTMPNNWVYALMAHDDGSGSKLYAGGQFSSIGGINTIGIARWNGSAWTALGTGVSGNVKSFARYDDGSGSGVQLFVGGDFSFASGVATNDVAKWTGSAWIGLGGGVAGASNGVSALCAHDDGSGTPALYAGGDFTSAGSVPAARFARWNGANWSTLGSGLNAEVRALQVFDDGAGDGPQLVAGGSFISAGGAASRRVARWNGAHWTQLGAGFNAAVNALAVFDDGSGGGPALYAGGVFNLSVPASTTGVARWTGSSWVGLPPGPGGVVDAFAVFDDGSGSALYAGGNFGNDGPVSKWNGSSWVPIAGAFPFTGVSALRVFDDGLGGGPALYAGGELSGGLRRWDGAAWSIVGGGVSGTSFPDVRALVVHDDGLGGGPSLYVGGAFSMAGSITAYGIARWDGLAWSALAGGVESPDVPGSPGLVSALESYRDPASGAAWLAAGGYLGAAGGTSASYVARWNGSSWSAFGSGANDEVNALAFHDAGLGTGARLFAGGIFSSVPDSGDAFLAAWGCDGDGAIATFCSGDGTGTACPCANSGAAGHGCASSVVAAGARLLATGIASIAADSVVLAGSGMPNASALYFQGTARVAGGAGVVFGDGLRCAGGAVARLKLVLNMGGGSHYPESGDPSLHVKGNVTVPGTRTYQCWYRNPATFCTASTFNLSNGLEIAWGA